MHEIPVLFFFAFTLWRYSLWKDKQSRKNYFYLVLGVILGALSGWPGYYIAPIINVYHYLSTRKINPQIIFLLFWPLVTFALHLYHNYVLTGQLLGGGLGTSFWFRSTKTETLRYLQQELSYIFLYFTKPLVLLAAVGIAVTRERKQLYLLLALLVFGLLHPLLFQEAAFRHDYLIYYLLPFVALSAALFVNWLWQKNSMLAAGVALAAILVGTLQTQRYLAELLVGARFKSGVVIGRYLERYSKPDDKVLLIIPQDLEFEGWHTTFYADRQVETIRESQDRKDAGQQGFDVRVDYRADGSMFSQKLQR